MLRTDGITTSFRIQDMPKVHSPLVREERSGGYYVTDEVNTDDDGNSYAWVFEDDRTRAVEKLDGTNVSVLIQNGEVTGVWNRTNRITLLPADKYEDRIVEGVKNARIRGYLDRLPDGQHFGELMGPKVQGNPYDLDDHIWIPFASYAQRHLRYESFGKYGTRPEDIRGWFKEGLIPLFYARWHDVIFDEAKKEGFVEGIMFTHPEPEDIGTIPYAKLRYDMFEFYDGPTTH